MSIYNILIHCAPSRRVLQFIGSTAAAAAAASTQFLRTFDATTRNPLYSYIHIRRRRRRLGSRSATFDSAPHIVYTAWYCRQEHCKSARSSERNSYI